MKNKSKGRTMVVSLERWNSRLKSRSRLNYIILSEQ